MQLKLITFSSLPRGRAVLNSRELKSECPG